MPANAVAFFDNLAAALEARGVTAQALSARIGAGPRYVSNLLRERHSPSIEKAMAIAAALDMTLAALLSPPILPGGADGISQSSREIRQERRDRAGFNRPTIETILAWWRANGGRLEAHGHFRHYFEIFEAPDMAAGMPRPLELGRESTTATLLGLEATEELRRLFLRSDPSLARLVAAAHHNARTAPQISTHSIRFASHSTVIGSVDYERLLLPVTHRGRRLILNFARPIRRLELSEDSPARAGAEADRDQASIFSGYSRLP